MDHNFELKKVTIGGVGGSAFAQWLERIGEFTLADIASILTIVYLAWLLSTSIYDRFKKKGP